MSMEFKKLSSSQVATLLEDNPVTRSFTHGGMLVNILPLTDGGSSRVVVSAQNDDHLLITGSK